MVERLIALRTNNGNYVTVVNGGGLGGPNDGPNAVAIHADAAVAGPWEEFHLVWLPGPNNLVSIPPLAGHLE